MDPIKATIGGRALDLRITGKSLRTARAQGIDTGAALSFGTGGDVDFVAVSDLLYIAAIHDQPAITADEIDALVDLREVATLVPTLVRLVQHPDAPAAEGKDAPPQSL